MTSLGGTKRLGVCVPGAVALLSGPLPKTQSIRHLCVQCQTHDDVSEVQKRKSRCSFCHPYPHNTHPYPGLTESFVHGLSLSLAMSIVLLINQHNAFYWSTTTALGNKPLSTDLVVKDHICDPLGNLISQQPPV